MLILSRKLDGTIKIGDDVVIKVIGMSRSNVKIGIEAPKHVRVLRGELMTDPALANVVEACDDDDLEHQHLHEECEHVLLQN